MTTEIQRVHPCDYPSNGSPRHFRVDATELAINEEHAKTARKVVKHFQRLVGGDPKESVDDLLLSIMHMCDRGLNYDEFGTALYRATERYDASIQHLVYWLEAS